MGQRLIAQTIDNLPHRPVILGAIAGGASHVLTQIAGDPSFLTAALSSGIGAGIGTVDPERVLEQLKRHDNRLDSILRRSLKAEISRFNFKDCPITSKRGARFDVFGVLTSEANSVFERNSKKIFSLPFQGHLRSWIYNEYASSTNLRKIVQSSPLRVRCPAIHPLAAAVFLHMRDYAGITFETLDLSGRLGIETLSITDERDFDFLVIAESPLYFWRNSGLLEHVQYIGHVTSSENRLIGLTKTNIDDVRVALFQSGTSGQEHLFVDCPNGAKPIGVDKPDYSLDDEVERLNSASAISMVESAADAYLASGKYRTLAKFPHETSLFSSLNSDFNSHPGLSKAFSEVFYGTANYLKRRPNVALDILKSDIEFMQHFNSSLFKARNFLQ